MTVSILNQSTQSITLQVTIPFTRSMLDSEKVLQDKLNEAANLATQELLKTFDTDGEALQLGSVKMTTKGQVAKLYPSAIRIGVADGAHDNWDFLIQHTDKQTLDFYHATEYLADVADSIFLSAIERKRWLTDRCHELKHTSGSAKTILAEMKQFEQRILKNQLISWTPSHPEEKIKGILGKQEVESVRINGKVVQKHMASDSETEDMKKASCLLTNVQ